MPDIEVTNYDIAGTALVQLECAMNCANGHGWNQSDVYDYLTGVRHDLQLLKARLRHPANT